MKKFIFFAVAACVALASCTKNEKIDTTADQLINFKAVVGLAQNLKSGPISGTKYESTAPTFGAAALYYNTEDNSKDGSEWIPAFTEMLYDGSSWSAAEGYYWPKAEGSSLTTYAFSPYSVNTYMSLTTSTTYGITVTDYDTEVEKDADLMLATPAKGQTSNTEAKDNGTAYDGVPTVFHHVLAYVDSMSVKTKKAVPSNQQFLLNKIELVSINHKGTFTDAWELDDDQVTVTLYENTDGLALSEKYQGATTNKVGYYFLMPQTFADETQAIQITYTIKYTSSGITDGPNTKTIYLKDSFDGFEKNKAYTFNFILSGDEILFAPSAVDWTAESYDITVE